MRSFGIRKIIRGTVLMRPGRFPSRSTGSSQLAVTIPSTRSHMTSTKVRPAGGGAPALGGTLTDDSRAPYGELNIDGGWIHGHRWHRVGRLLQVQQHECAEYAQQHMDLSG